MYNPPSIVRRMSWPILGFSFLWMIFQSAILANVLSIPCELAGFDSTITIIMILLFSIVASLALSYYQPKRNKQFFALLLGVVLAFTCTLFTDCLLHQLPNPTPEYLEALALGWWIRFAVIFLFIQGTIIVVLLWHQIEEQQAVFRREAATANMLKEAELHKLQHQLQPHFLFNSLNSINALILMKPEEARQMLQQLSDFLRTTLKRADQQHILLKDEMDYLQLYLAIEKVRFGHRLKTDLQVAPGTEHCSLPTLLLQPIVENAIKFGLYGTTQHVTIRMETRLENQMLYITVANPFDPDMITSHGTGFGLNGIRRRLYLLYTRNDLLETRTTEDNTFITSLKIPLPHDKNSIN